MLTTQFEHCTVYLARIMPLQVSMTLSWHHCFSCLQLCRTGMDCVGWHCPRSKRSGPDSLASTASPSGGRKRAGFRAGTGATALHSTARLRKPYRRGPEHWRTRNCPCSPRRKGAGTTSCAIYSSSFFSAASFSAASPPSSPASAPAASAAASSASSYVSTPHEFKTRHFEKN